MLKVESPLAEEQERLVTVIMDCAFAVHRALGPGFRERIYERALCLEMDSRNLRFECEIPIEVRYREWRIPGQKLDLLVERTVLVEVKAVPKLRPIHTAQVVSYLKTLNLRVGLLLNCNSVALKYGLKRIVH